MTFHGLGRYYIGSYLWAPLWIRSKSVSANRWMKFALNWIGRQVRGQSALPLAGWAVETGLADMSDCVRCGSGQEETVLHAFYYSERVRPVRSYVREWTARIDPKQLGLLDVDYVVDNVYPPWKGEKQVVFLAILAGELGDAKEGIVWQCKLFSLRSDFFYASAEGQNQIR